MISVIIPTYNCERYINDAINSVLNQTYKCVEIIIIDDGSSDKTYEVLQPYRNCENIHYYFQNNKGAGAARNKGIELSKGEYIAFLDADDEWLPSFLEFSIKMIETHNCQWIVTAGHRIELDEYDNEITREKFNKEYLCKIDNLYHELLKEDVVGVPSQMVFKKECFYIAGFFREDLRIREDWEMWIRMARHGIKICGGDEPLMLYKVRKKSTTKSNPFLGLTCTYNVIEMYKLEAFKISIEYKKIYAEKMWNIARLLYYQNKMNSMLFIKSIIKSQTYCPSITRVFNSIFSIINKNERISA